MNAGEQVTHAQLICGQVYGLIDNLLCELELICEEYPEEDQDHYDQT